MVILGELSYRCSLDAGVTQNFNIFLVFLDPVYATCKRPCNRVNLDEREKQILDSHCSCASILNYKIYCTKVKKRQNGICGGYFTLIPFGSERVKSRNRTIYL